MYEFKKEHTKAEWIAMFEKAKELALRRYVGHYRIVWACGKVGIVWPENSTFDAEGRFENECAPWLSTKGNTDERVAAVFDNSIAAIRRGS